MAVDYRYHFTDNELKKDWDKLVKTKVFKSGAQFKPGMKLCQHYCDNFWTIQNQNGKSFADSWNDYVIMDKVRLWGLSSMSQLWLSWIRRAVFMAAGLPNSSFYRPHFAKQIIKMHGNTSGRLFDPCMGWGGRMLGTLSENDWHYTSCDPNTITYNNVLKMVDFLDMHNRVSLNNIPAEDFDFDSVSNFDIILTSPPYFNLEVYNQDENQSYNKFNTYSQWRDKWLFPLVTKSLSKLNDNGLSCWNVMNFKKNDLVGDIIKIHEDNGYILLSTVGFDSPLSNIRTLKNKDITYIFKKG